MNDLVFREPKRALRIRMRQRMRNKAFRKLFPLSVAQDKESRAFSRWKDVKGQQHTGVMSFDDVMDLRKYQVVRLSDNMAHCSCYMCGNPRRWWRELTRQELRSDSSFKYQMECESFPSTLDVENTKYRQQKR